jgi:hypothetical protein
MLASGSQAAEKTQELQSNAFGPVTALARKAA